MRGFDGFPQRGRMIKVPGVFFSDLLPQIDNLAELKVTLYCFWRLQRKEGNVFYLRLKEILDDPTFMSSLGADEDERHTALIIGLERAVVRGTLLHAAIRDEEIEEDLYFVNAPRGRAAVEGIEHGNWRPTGFIDSPVELILERPNVFTLYEQNIGPLTPLIADRLRDAEETYSPEWVAEAIEIAVQREARSWRFIEAVLKRWQREGKLSPGERPRSPGDGRRFLQGKYGDEFEH